MLKPEELLLQRAYANEERKPDATYMVQPTGNGNVETYTWARTLDEARRVANYLKSLDLEPGSKIAMISKNCASFIITDLAIWMAGHVSVAIFPTLDADTVAYILDHSDSELVFVGKLDVYDEMEPGIPEDMPRIVMPLAPEKAYSAPNTTTWKSILADNDPIEGSPVRDPEDLAIIVYTSGSTGKPKGVMHNFFAMAVAARGIGPVVDLTENERMLSYLPLAHVLERWLVETTSIFYGFQVYFAESIETFVADLQRAEPTIFVSVPRLWLKFQMGVQQKMPQKRLNLLLKIPILNNIIRKKILTGLGLQHVRYAASGSAPIPADVIQWYRDLGLELLEGYGMSENFAYSHATQPGRTRVGYVGEAYPEVEAKISEEGEILVKSPGNMMGYYKMEEATKECFTEDGFLKTGDRGEVDEQGRFRITGRVKELFKTSKGKYVAPAPIENIINNHSAIGSSCVFGVGRPKACAVVNLSEDVQERIDQPGVREEVQAQLEELLSEVNRKVVGYEQLQFLAVAREPWTIENKHLTPTMKIKRSTIEESYEGYLEDWYAAGEKVQWER
jgi:long-subunit acyl-CoA synthetase (AMP-forming)